MPSYSSQPLIENFTASKIQRSSRLRGFELLPIFHESEPMSSTLCGGIIAPNLEQYHIRLVAMVLCNLKIILFGSSTQTSYPPGLRGSRFGASKAFPSREGLYNEASILRPIIVLSSKHLKPWDPWVPRFCEAPKYTQATRRL